MNIGWIDFSKEERDKALDLLRLFQEMGAVDELGIGIARDAFADRFFPGTSTLMTRAKYFVVVPYIIQEKLVEGARTSQTVRETLNLINDEERRFAERMLKKHSGDKNARIIGSTALGLRRWVKRSPSELYWNGIRTLGIHGNRGMSLSQFISAGLEYFRSRAKSLGTVGRGESEEGDDVDAGRMTGFKPMDINGIYRRGWMKDADISLTRAEAVFLCDKIRSNISGSVFATALENRVDMLKYGGDFIAFAEGIMPDVNADTRRLLELACYFSRIVYAARVRYNIMIQGDRSDVALQCWDEFLKEGVPAVSRMNEVICALEQQGVSLNYNGTKHFLLSLAESFHSSDWMKMDFLVKQREIAIKGKERAKLLHCEKYSAENWIGGGYLEYRLSDVARIVADIIEGLEGEDVQS